MLESFSIMMKYVPRDELKKVAEVILLSQDKHEDSWNPDTSSYSKSIFISSQEAIKELKLDIFWVNIIHGWNVNLWNDVQDFAKDIIKKIY